MTAQINYNIQYIFRRIQSPLFKKNAIGSISYLWTVFKSKLFLSTVSQLFILLYCDGWRNCFKGRVVFLTAIALSGHSGKRQGCCAASPVSTSYDKVDTSAGVAPPPPPSVLYRASCQEPRESRVWGRNGGVKGCRHDKLRANQCVV